MQFQVDTQFVEKVGIIQDPFRAYQQPNNPWDTKGRVHIGDFVLVTRGEFAGREGFVKFIHTDSSLVVAETKQESNQPLLIVEGWHSDAQVQAVSGCSQFFCPHTYFQPDDIHCSFFGHVLL
jgi:hypothetical protein